MANGSVNVLPYKFHPNLVALTIRNFLMLITETGILKYERGF